MPQRWNRILMLVTKHEPCAKKYAEWNLHYSLGSSPWNTLCSQQGGIDTVRENEADPQKQI